MAFWDFVRKLVGKPTPPASPPTAASQPRAAAPPPPAAGPSTGPVAGDFQPIQRDDLYQQGADVRRASGWMWFGRRDLIPPTSDPRTFLIDRGMVTQGFLTPEQLAEMH